MAKIFDDLIEIWSHELKELYDNGFQANGHTWHVIILGFTGDAPFVKKIAKTNSLIPQRQEATYFKECTEGVLLVVQCRLRFTGGGSFLSF